MQTFCAERARDRANAGMAITARSPITATTIMISVKVKPAWGTCRALMIIKLMLCLLFRADSQPAFFSKCHSVTAQKMRGGYKSGYPGHTRGVESRHPLGCSASTLRQRGDSYAAAAAAMGAGKLRLVLAARKASLKCHSGKLAPS